ncbi:MAG: lysophospholipid acyltransferase family protein [Rhodospirillaceae bacterium]|nr:lysophospholipid acyltransferase family protein [Rhodospirillaceae bacterium]
MADLRNKLKHFSRGPAVRRGLRALTTAHIRLVKATTRWQTLNAAAAEPAWRGDEAVIVAFWHERLALMAYCWASRRPFHMLISSHPDGQVIAGAVAAFGISTVAGSTTHGGGEALRRLVRKLKAGESIGVTPDGPRGPRRQAQDGVLAMARLSGAAILPAAVGLSHALKLNTWDRLIVGLPFGRGAMVWGAPLRVAKDADAATMAETRARLTAELNRVSDAADRIAEDPQRHVAA